MLTFISALPASAAPLVSAVQVIAVRVLDHSHSLLEVVLLELALLIHNHVDAVGASGEEVVLKGSWAEIGKHNMAWFFVTLRYPVGEFHGVGYGGGEEDEVTVFR